MYLINDAELMTQEAQNWLLKTLEEPPEYIVIILITSNENKVLNTIKSRCMKLYFNNLDKNSVKKVLTEKFERKYKWFFFRCCRWKYKKSTIN